MEGFIDGVAEDDEAAHFAAGAGIEAMLRRMSRRLEFRFDLAAAVAVLEAQYEGYREDFEAFFSMLKREVGVR